MLTAATPAGADAVLQMARAADRMLRNRSNYQRELASWTGRRARRDGVPARASGPWDALELVPVRDFAGPSRPRATEPFEPYPTIMVLATAGDTRGDWLHAGQALQRVLLTATWLGLSTMPISQPVEVTPVRAELATRTPGMSPQIVLRVGYDQILAPSSTPRRPLAAVLIPADAPG